MQPSRCQRNDPRKDQQRANCSPSNNSSTGKFLKGYCHHIIKWVCVPNLDKEYEKQEIENKQVLTNMSPCAEINFEI